MENFAVKNLISIATISLVFLTFLQCVQNSPSKRPGDLDPGILLKNKDLQLLGEKLFYDKNLSEPTGQACVACHSPETGWTGPDLDLNKKGGIYQGAVSTRFGNRKPGTSAYATLSPVFHAVIENGVTEFIGGNFWDGRATGKVLGNPAADQAQGPFLNPVEHNIPDAKILIEKVCRSDYSELFKKVGKELWGVNSLCSIEDTELQFGIIGIAIAAFEHSEKVNSFSSKFDLYIENKADLTPQELMGLALFNGKGKCSICHTSTMSKDGTHPLFTDFRFDNLGIPSNPLNPWYTMDSSFNNAGELWTDPGLGDFLKTLPEFVQLADQNLGKHRVPTLRNVDKRPSSDFIKAYGHNGYFKSLEEIVHFYNTRDILPQADEVEEPQPGINCWPAPEVSQNINTRDMGNLGLNPEEERAIVAFLKTLSDGYEK